MHNSLCVPYICLWYNLINISDVIDEMYNIAKEEMNFLIEAKHLEEFRENNLDTVYI